MSAARSYQIIVNRAAVLDRPDAIYHDTLRPDAILGYLPHGAIITGPVVSAAVTPDLTAHAIRITYPVDVPPHAGVVAYVLRSQVAQVTL